MLQSAIADFDEAFEVTANDLQQLAAEVGFATEEPRERIRDLDLLVLQGSCVLSEDISLAQDIFTLSGATHLRQYGKPFAARRLKRPHPGWLSRRARLVDIR